MRFKRYLFGLAGRLLRPEYTITVRPRPGSCGGVSAAVERVTVAGEVGPIRGLPSLIPEFDSIDDAIFYVFGIHYLRVPDLKIQYKITR